MSFLIPRQTLLGALLALCLLSSAQAASEDKIIPSYRVDAAACSTLNAGGRFTVNIDPAEFENIVAVQNMEVAAAILPDTPVFLFFAYHQATFFDAVYQFAPSMHCLTNAVFGPDNMLHFTHMPAGRYIVLETTAITVNRAGSVQTTQPYVAPMFAPELWFWNPPQPQANTTVTSGGQETWQSIFGAILTITADGKMTMGNVVRLGGDGH